MYPALAIRPHWLLAGVAVLVALISAFAYAASDVSWGASPPGSESKVRPGVAGALSGQPDVPVIVTLREPAALQDSPLDLPVLRSQVSEEQAGVLASLTTGDFDLKYRYGTVPALAGMVSADGLAALIGHPYVVDVALDAQGSAALGQSVPLINADDVHAGGVTGAGIIVAVLDTGIDTDHPDLSDDIAYERCYLSGGDCPVGPHPAEDDHGHGTNVSGIITGNGVVAPIGVAPDAQIAAYKILSASGFGSFSDITAALDDIINNHPEVDIVNMSLSSGVSCPAGALATAIATLRSQGVATFIAAGNRGNKSALNVPACIPEGLSVGAVYDANVGKVNIFFGCSDLTTSADKVACWSDSDSSLDLLAPGGRISAAGRGGGISNYYGTSQAAPHGAGTAALMLDQNGALTVDQIEACLEGTGVPILDPGNGLTKPRIDAFAAVGCAVAGTPTPTACPTEGCPTPTDTPTSTPTPTPCVAPANDDFANSVVIGGIPYTASLSTFCATTQVGEPSPCVGIGATVWYDYTPSVTETLRADTTGSNFDTTLAIYTGATLGTLTVVGCDDDSGPGLTSLLTFSATAGTSYHVQAGGFFGSRGNLVFNLGSVPTPTPCPTEGCPTPTETPTATPTRTRTPTRTPTPVPRPDFSIGIDTNGDNTDDCRTKIGSPTTCTLPAGSMFKLKAYLNSLPNGVSGYTSFDLSVGYTGVSSKDNASTAPWPDCGFPAAYFAPGHVLWGCGINVLQARPSTYTGLIGTNDFNCAASGTITLVHGPNDTALSDEALVEYFDAGTESLAINCAAVTPGPPLGGVADYPNTSSGPNFGLPASAAGALAAVLTLLVGVAWRRSAAGR